MTEEQDVPLCDVPCETSVQRVGGPELGILRQDKCPSGVQLTVSRAIRAMRTGVVGYGRSSSARERRGPMRITLKSRRSVVNTR